MMKRGLVSLAWFCGFYISMILVQYGGYGLGCLEEERVALLNLKAAFNSSTISWDASMISNCCAWDRVTCDNTTRRVIQLSLLGSWPWYRGELYLNASLFLPFEELQSLDLSLNNLRGWSEEEGFKTLSKLKNLQVLHLGWNALTNLTYLGTLTSLKSLLLGPNNLEGSSPIRELITLKKLEQLDLWNNGLNEAIFPYIASLASLKVLGVTANNLSGSLPIQELSKLTKLETLDLRFNKLNGSISPSIGLLTSLRTLRLGYNGLSSHLPTQGLCELKNLQVLDLSGNTFDGDLPLCLGSLTSLSILDFSRNQLKGSILSSLVSNLTSLQYLDLSNNKFDGLLSFSSFANNSDLKVLKFQNNNQLRIETENPPNWVPKFQLELLNLANCLLNNPIATIPSFLCKQYELYQVDLSHSNLKGDFPSCLLENKTNLQYLSISNNSFSGHLPDLLPHFNYSNLQFFDISINHIHGELPWNIGILFSNLMFLNISKNALQGSLPPSIGDMGKLEWLDMSDNNVSGEVPEKLFTGCFSLKSLKLSRNNLHGQLLPKTSNLTELTAFALDGNKFTGEISNGLFNSSKLMALSIGDNFVSGELPSWIETYPQLSWFDMSQNSLQGHIPSSFCNLNNLRFLDFSHNDLNGIIPSCFNLSSLKYFHLEDNSFVGTLPNFLSQNSSSILTLDIRNNYLSGKIPSWIHTLSSLKILLLKGNRLQGPIPTQLCNLHKIGIMDLSRNYLSGSIPPCFNNLSFGRWDLTNDAFTEVAFATPPGVFQVIVIKLPDNSNRTWLIDSSYGSTVRQEEVQFVTKGRFESYKGDILHYMSGLDLSDNKLTGHIPTELGDLNGIHSLNLSHNFLTGTIPEVLSNLTQLESLDLSSNGLSGAIPPQLTGLTFLGTFSVAYNNLSGRTPDMKNQFATFGESSYEGNSQLCGPPLPKKCNSNVAKPTNREQDHPNDGFLDSFFISFAIAYIIGLFGFVGFLYVNPRFYYVVSFICEFVTYCLFSVLARCKLNLHKLLRM